jgi:CheY-like chemotaxis protein
MLTTERQGSRPLCVLIVDDWPDTAEVMAQVLNTEGFKTTAVRNAEAALQALDVEWPDVVLLDIAMPSVNGYELARRIRNLALDKKCPRIAAVTGNARPQDRDRSLAEGLDEHFVKPTDLRTLVAWLRQTPAIR